MRNRYVRVIAIFALSIFVGLSRPYLPGVHYLEDILLGWPNRVGCRAWIGVKYGDRIAAAWNEHAAMSAGVAMMVAASALLWLVTIAINGWQIDGEPLAFLGYAGFLTGIVIGGPLELRFVNFDPRSSNIAAKIARYVISVGMVILTLELLGKVNASLADNFLVAGYVLTNMCAIRPAAWRAFSLAPLVFTGIGLAKRLDKR